MMKAMVKVTGQASSYPKQAERREYSTADKLRIVLVDDQRISRAGLRQLLTSHDNLSVVSELDNIREALTRGRMYATDVLLLNASTADSFDPDDLSSFMQVYAGARIAIITNTMNAAKFSRALRLGVSALLLGDQTPDILVQAIEKAHTGEGWFDPRIIRMLASELSQTVSMPLDSVELAKIESLTTREREIVGLLTQGLTNQAIAERLHITDSTVRYHLSGIFGKLDVANRLELVSYAYKNRVFFEHEVAKNKP